MKDVGETFKKLGYYFATVLIGLFIHGGLTLPIIMCEFITGTFKVEIKPTIKFAQI